jgi:nucleotide-binding universal stress UspA family protein
MSEAILVPHDLTELSDAVLAHPLVSEAGRVHVLNVLPRIDPLTPVLVWPRDEDEQRIAHARRVLAARLRGSPHEDAVLHVQIGDPASRIVELAQELSVRMIVMPTHSRSGLAHLLLGSVAEHVVRFAPCPVLVLPAAVTAARLPPLPSEPALDCTPEEQVEALACELLSRAEHTPGYLTAARIAIPHGADADWWESALQQRLAASGIEFVDLVFAQAPTQQARILAFRFDEPAFV